MKISERVRYIGVNDRTTHKFEAMWPLPLGVSYNSYIVVGSEKVAIIDGVEVNHAARQIERIKEILGDRRPDYLVINHMEPDHSGAIGCLHKEWPDLTIVGNAQTLNMVSGYYGDNGTTLAVKDGDNLPLGPETTLCFALTPMVHWPETMMTYLKEEELLFSGDAFGCFGALNGAVVDTDMDTAPYFPEMVRYYSNIVGRYGCFVQRAFKRLEGIPVSTICSTHGPVWRSKLTDVLALYDKLSRYEPLDNGVTIVYGSMYGHTELMAEVAASALAEAGVRKISVINASVTDLSHIIAEVFTHRGLILASPTYSDGLFPPVRAVAEALAVRKLRDRDVLLFGTHTWAPQAVKTMQGILADCAVDIAGEPVMGKQSPTDEVLEQCREAARALAARLVE